MSKLDPFLDTTENIGELERLAVEIKVKLIELEKAAKINAYDKVVQMKARDLIREIQDYLYGIIN